MTKYTYDANLRQVVPIVESGPEKPVQHAPVQPVVAPGAIAAQVSAPPSAPVWQRPATPQSEDN